MKRTRDRSTRNTGFEYRPPKASTMRKHARQRGNAATDPYILDGVELYRVREDANRIRIMPPTWDQDDEERYYGYDLSMHYGIGPERQHFVCPRSVGAGDCPICEEHAQVEAEGDDEEYAASLRRKDRVAMYVIDRKDQNAGPKLWVPSWTFRRDLAEQAYDDDTKAILFIDSPDDGYDVMFNRKPLPQGHTLADIKVARRSSPLHESSKTARKWLKQIEKQPVPECFIIYDYEHLSKAFAGPGGSSSARRSKKTKSSDVDLTWEEVHDLEPDDLADLIDEHKLDLDPDDFEDAEELADVVCDELGIKKSKKKGKGKKDDTSRKRSKRRRVEDDDEDEEEDEDDDEEEDDEEEDDEDEDTEVDEEGEDEDEEDEEDEPKKDERKTKLSRMKRKARRRRTR